MFVQQMIRTTVVVNQDWYILKIAILFFSQKSLKPS